MLEKSNSLEAIAHSEDLAIAENNKAKKTRFLLSLVIGIGSTLALLGILTLFVKFIIEEPDAQLIAYQAPAPAKQVIKEKPKKIPPPTEEIPIISQNTNATVTIEVPDIEIPEIEIDEMDLEAEDFEMDIPSFEDLALSAGDMEMTSMFGGKSMMGNCLIGYFYDLKQTPKNEDTRISNTGYYDLLREFLKEWDEKLLEPYFKSPTALLTSQIIIPNMSADEAPKAFDLEDVVQPAKWLIHYTGQLKAPQDCTFRFVGSADDVLCVRVNNKLSIIATAGSGKTQIGDYGKVNKEEFRFGFGLQAGDWITMKKGEIFPMEVILGEVPGGKFYAALLVQMKDEKYETSKLGYPILPIFQTAHTNISDEIKQSNLETLNRGMIFDN